MWPNRPCGPTLSICHGHAFPDQVDHLSGLGRRGLRPYWLREKEGRRRRLKQK